MIYKVDNCDFLDRISFGFLTRAGITALDEYFHIFATTNSKPFGKRLSTSAEMPNHLGNDFRHARKCQTIREMTFAKRGNAKPLKK